MKIDDCLYVSVPKSTVTKEEALQLIEKYNVKYICFGTSRKYFKREDVEKW